MNNWGLCESGSRESAPVVICVRVCLCVCVHCFPPILYFSIKFLTWGFSHSVLCFKNVRFLSCTSEVIDMEQFDPLPEALSLL